MPTKLTHRCGGTLIHAPGDYPGYYTCTKCGRTVKLGAGIPHCVYEPRLPKLRRISQSDKFPR